MGGGEPGTGSELERGRGNYRRHEWADAFGALSRADGAASLEADDLERLGWSAGLCGHDEVMLDTFERLYHLHDDAGAHARAARCGFWLGLRLVAMAEPARGAGWLSRAQRSVERVDGDCVERGYLMLPMVARELAAGDIDAAADTAAQAAAIGERFGEADLVAFAQQFQGRALLRRGDTERGMALLDESMISVTSGELSPIVAGLVYCSAISSCQQVLALDRSREWTAALASWCDGEPQLTSFTGPCLVHRSQILQMSGDWAEAFEEAKRACELVTEKDPQALGDACYERAELHRLRGEHDAAEEAYGHASRVGREPQPGLALLRLAQGRRDDAVSAIRRVLTTTSSAWRRPQFLPACVEILLAAGQVDEARAASRELDQLAQQFGTEILAALADQARGAVLLAEGDAGAAVEPLRGALQCWQTIGAPYIAARIRVLLGRACEVLGDRDGTELERRAARQVFEALGAASDLAALDAGAVAPEPPADTHGLSPRELEVLRLVAKGKTNKEIARELCVSERTIDRHVSNFFTKLDVSTRAAATAFAYEHALV
jgi:ATP/maltotriose-dependent transcriptional regulator MalT